MRRAALFLLAFAQAACGAARPSDPATSPHAIEAQRVARILEHRHPSHAKLDGDVATRAFDRLLRTLDPSSGCAQARSALDWDGARLVAAFKRGDFGFAMAAARACRGRALAPDEAKRLSLDALASTYDLHSHYLDAKALARRRRDTTNTDAAVARGRLIEHAAHRIAWIELPSFYVSKQRSTTGDVRFLGRELQARGATVLLLDLRGNGGGVIAEALALAGALLRGGPLAYQRDAEGRLRALEAKGASAFWSGAVVVLIDARTASAAELFAGALQDRGGALILGNRSHGNGLAQTLVLLSSPLGGTLGAVEVTERAFYRLDASALHGLGIAPDVELAASAPGSERVGGLGAWAPARVDSLPAGALQRIDAQRVERVRAAMAAAGSSELEQILAATAAYAATADGPPR